MDMYEFIVDADGILHGAGDDSGMTTFEGKVEADGSFSGSYLRFDGSAISGKIEAGGYVSGSSEIRGRVSTFESRGGKPAEVSAPAQEAGDSPLPIATAFPTAAPIDLRMYSATGDTAYQNSAVSHLKNALVHWNTYAMDFASRYQPMLMGRLQLAPSPTELLTNVEKDISQAQSWKIGR